MGIAAAEFVDDPSLDEFEWMRQVRNATEYPDRDRPTATAQDVTEAIGAADAIASITAYRAAYAQPKAWLGRQGTTGIAGCLTDTTLWVVPQPSGLNAHENIETFAAKWREVRNSAAARPVIAWHR